MPTLHEYDYIFAIGVIFATLDAYNIGANDVANSFATSVSSRSLTLRQAVVLAAIMEFLGAILAGSRVAGTIKNGIISLSVFENNPGVELLAFTCALVASATWLTVATYNAWPVSTTYSIVSSLAGVGVALGGADAVQWGWNGGKGLGTIFAGFGIAPGIAAGFGGVVFLLTKFLVLKRQDPVRAAMIASPVYFFGVTAILTLTIVYKGAPNLHLDKLSGQTQALAIVMTSLVIAVLSLLFWLPYVYAKVVRKDYTIRFYHFFYGPLLWRRPAPPPMDADVLRRHVPDYRQYDRDLPDASSHGQSENAEERTKMESKAEQPDDEASSGQSAEHTPTAANEVPLGAVEKSSPQIEGPWIYPRNLWIIVRYRIPRILTYGLSVDVASEQGQKGTKDEQRMLAIHQASEQYGNETEHLYSFLQVLTACTNSFAHGSNDTANAIGPFAVIYHVWKNGVLTTKNTETPTWMWAFGGIMIGIGVATYGYNVMRVLGNRLTLMSPSRGFSMELGSSITVLLASQYGIPVSTTMCITGSTAGVGLVSGGYKAVNWRAFGWIFLGWVLTVPIAGLAGGLLMGIILNAPHF